MQYNRIMAIKQRSKSLSARGSELSDTFFQLQVLNGKELVDANFPKFAKKVAEIGHSPLRPTPLEIFQLNIGKLCNQTCAHCHVDAGPDKRRENMDKATLERCLEIIATVPSITTVDITGGAPEMNPHFRWFVAEASKLGKQVIDRCNLTIIRANKKYHDLPEFLAAHKVKIVSSLPYFSKSRTDKQRGDGVFEDSIEALQMLNAVGYGQEGTGLDLDFARVGSSVSSNRRRSTRRVPDWPSANAQTSTVLPASQTWIGQFEIGVLGGG